MAYHGQSLVYPEHEPRGLIKSIINGVITFLFPENPDQPATTAPAATTPPPVVTTPPPAATTAPPANGGGNDNTQNPAQPSATANQPDPTNNGGNAATNPPTQPSGAGTQTANPNAPAATDAAGAANNLSGENRFGGSASAVTVWTTNPDGSIQLVTVAPGMVQGVPGSGNSGQGNTGGGGSGGPGGSGGGNGNSGSGGNGTGDGNGTDQGPNGGATGTLLVSPGIIVLIVLLVFALLFAIVFFIVRRRRRRQQALAGDQMESALLDHGTGIGRSLSVMPEPKDKRNTPTTRQPRPPAPALMAQYAPSPIVSHTIRRSVRTTATDSVFATLSVPTESRPVSGISAVSSALTATSNGGDDDLDSLCHAVPVRGVYVHDVGQRRAVASLELARPPTHTPSTDSPLSTSVTLPIAASNAPAPAPASPEPPASPSGTSNTSLPRETSSVSDTLYDADDDDPFCDPSQRLHIIRAFPTTPSVVQMVAHTTHLRTSYESTSTSTHVTTSTTAPAGPTPASSYAQAYQRQARGQGPPPSAFPPSSSSSSAAFTYTGPNRPPSAFSQPRPPSAYRPPSSSGPGALSRHATTRTTTTVRTTATGTSTVSGASALTSEDHDPFASPCPSPEFPDMGIFGMQGVTSLRPNTGRSSRPATAGTVAGSPTSTESSMSIPTPSAPSLNDHSGEVASSSSSSGAHSAWFSIPEVPAVLPR